MKKEVIKITGDWVENLVKMKVGQIAEIPIVSYDNIMSSARYRAKRRYNIAIERVGDFDYKKGIFKIKRTA